MTVKEKRYESLKGWSMADRHKQQGTMEKDKSVSPTVGLDSVFTTAIIESVEGRDVAVVDLHGAYLSANMNNDKEVCMVLRGPLANLMALTTPKVYRKLSTIHILGRKLLHVKLQKALYGLLKQRCCSTVNYGAIHMARASK